MKTRVNSEPAAAFARAAAAASASADAFNGYGGESDDRPTRRQPALELLALHEASVLGGNAADDLAVPIAGVTDTGAAASAGEPVAGASAGESASTSHTAEPKSTASAGAPSPTTSITETPPADRIVEATPAEPVAASISEPLAAASKSEALAAASAAELAGAPSAEVLAAASAEELAAASAGELAAAPKTEELAATPGAEALVQAPGTESVAQAPGTEQLAAASAVELVACSAAEPTAVEAAPSGAAAIEPAAASSRSDATASPGDPASRNLLSTAIDAVPKEIDDARTQQASGPPTTRTPALDVDHHPDRIAERRGLPPLAQPRVRRQRDYRGWMIVSAAFSVACLVVAVCVVGWARGEVARARAERQDAPPLVASNGVVPLAPAAMSPDSTARSAPVSPSAPAQIAPTCAIHVTTNVDDATVYIDGIPHGTAPADVPVACGIDTLVELRHPRYESFKRSLSVEDGTLEVEAHLEREKTELTVWSDPPGATVTYNGHPLGKTPLVTKVNRYERGTLWFRAPGREADWRKIVPKEPAKTVSVKLKPRS